MMDSSDPIELRAGPYAATLLPRAGARLGKLRWSEGARSLDLVVPMRDGAAFDGHHWPNGGAFPMAPYSNRLGGASFAWDTRRIRLTSPPGETYALLGFAHRAAWDVIARAADRATLRYAHRPDDEGWPWRFELNMQVVLDADGAQVVLRITNLSDETMPAGLGWHPYHPAHWLAWQADARLRLTAHARRDVGLAGVARLEPHAGPTAAAPVELGGADLHHQTNVFEDWHGTLWLPLDDGLSMVVATTGARHLVMHAPAELAYVCLEPVSLLPGALQVYDAAQSAAMIALAPRAARELVWRCGVAPDRP